MRPLEGIKVIELASYVAAPAAGRLMGEMGAEVIKIESFKGDPNRGLGAINNAPCFEDENPIFDTTSFDKKFIVVDTKKPEGMRLLHRMLETADVFLTNYRSNVLCKMGLDYEALKERYPRLVWAQILGFGEQGPEKDTAGFDFTAFGARGGLAGSVGQDGVAINNINAFGDTQTSTALAAGILAALVARARTGIGDKVTVSLHNTAVYNLHWGILGAKYGSHYPKSRTNVLQPLINVYPASDGWVQVCGAAYDIYMPRAAKALGIEEEIFSNPDYATYEAVGRTGSAPAIIAMMDKIFPTKTVAEWIDIFRSIDVPLEKCYTFDDVLEDEQAWASGILTNLTYPNGKVNMVVNQPIRMASMTGHIPTPSRKIGADTREVLSGYGYSEAELEGLAAAGIIN